MRKIGFVLVIFVFVYGQVNAQCSANSLFTGLGLPGVYPPELPISGIPMVGISDGVVGSPYSETLTLVVLEDTSMDIASFLPAAAVSAMNLAGISTTMSLDVNHVTFDVIGLPNGLSFTCDQSGCQYISGVDGCILIDGIPNQGGNFSIPVSMTINAQIPPIIDPIFGTTIFAGMAIDVPSFNAVEYNLLVEGSTVIYEVSNYNSRIFPNPTCDYTILSLSLFSDVVVYDILGKEVFVANNVKENLVLLKDDIGKGMFYVLVHSKGKTEIIKLIIK